MTREEKISHLKDILSEINENDNAVCYLTSEDNELIESAIEALEQQPCYNPDEWCHNCSEYDHEKHCCPRYNKVIRNAVEEMKEAKTEHWIAVSERLPKIRQDVLCQCRGNNYSVFRLNHDSDWECIYPRTTYMQSFVIAWMPLPESYKENV